MGRCVDSVERPRAARRNRLTRWIWLIYASCHKVIESQNRRCVANRCHWYAQLRSTFHYFSRGVLRCLSVHDVVPFIPARLANNARGKTHVVK